MWRAVKAMRKLKISRAAAPNEFLARGFVFGEDQSKRRLSVDVGEFKCVSGGTVKAKCVPRRIGFGNESRALGRKWASNRRNPRR